jgi:hypothetical protein
MQICRLVPYLYRLLNNPRYRLSEYQGIHRPAKETKKYNKKTIMALFRRNVPTKRIFTQGHNHKSFFINIL